MRGLEIARSFYTEYGEPMINGAFGEYRKLFAVGLVGSGSECFGYDDELSQDHDFEPGFCIFVPDGALDRETLFKLERAYASLPKEYLGFRRQPISPAGGNRHGVVMLGDFLGSRTGHRDGKLTAREWMRLPEQYLAEVTNGELFFDGCGIFTSVREELSHMPRDVMLKKLTGHLFLMSQSGQYNYTRAVRRGDTASAQLASFEFVRHAMGAVFTLAGRYMPYYKWSFRALSDIPGGGDISDALEFLITSENDAKNASVKSEVTEDIARMISDELRARGLTDAPGTDLGRHALLCNDRIKDAEIRNLSILYAVD